MPQVRARYRFANTTLRDAAVYVPILDVDQWLEIGSAAPYDLYRITAVSSAGVGTFERVGGAGMTFGAVVAETVGGPNVNGIGTDAARNDHVHALPAFGTTAGTFAQGNDSRLSDSRAPTAHATSHKSGGADSIKLDELAAPTDVVTLNASTGAHGLLPKLPGGSSTFLRGDGTFATPPGGGAGSGMQPLYFTPASSHTDDYEFETAGTGAIPSGWTLWDRNSAAAITIDSGTIDPYTLPAAGHAKYNEHGSGLSRGSQGSLLLANDNHDCVFAKKPSSIATNCLIWGRMSSWFTNGSPPAADGQCMLGFFADSSSHPDQANCVCFGWRVVTSPSAQGEVDAISVAAGVTTVQGSSTQLLYAMEYFLIHKLNTTYHCYAFSDSGHCMHWASFTYATAVAWIGFYVRRNDSAGRPGVHKFDFIRRIDTATALPF